MSEHSMRRIIQYAEFESSDALLEDEKRLVASAWEARRNAYAPYSRFHVGAAVLTKDGQVILGSNQETANYMGSHAEKVALDAAGVAGIKNKVAKIAIVGGPDSLQPEDQANEPEEPVAPCGACRQDIKEVEDLSGNLIVIILASRSKIRRFVGIKQLLPFPFGSANLGISLK